MTFLTNLEKVVTGKFFKQTGQEEQAPGLRNRVPEQERGVSTGALAAVALVSFTAAAAASAAATAAFLKTTDTAPSIPNDSKPGAPDGRGSN